MFEVRVTAVLTALSLLAAGEIPEDAAVFAKDSKWETVADGFAIVEGIADAGEGSIYLTDVPNSELIRLFPDGRREILDRATSKANGLAIGPDGRLYAACMNAPELLRRDLKSGESTRLPLPGPANDLAIDADGRIFCTCGATNSVYRHDPDSGKSFKVAEMPNPNGIALSHDRSELLVAEFSGDTVRAYPLQKDGTLGKPRAAFRAKVPADGKGLLDGMLPLADGRLLIATALGLQILSPGEGAVVLPNPTPHRANYVRLITGADGRRWIYAAHVKSVLRRESVLEK